MKEMAGRGGGGEYSQRHLSNTVRQRPSFTMYSLAFKKEFLENIVI